MILENILHQICTLNSSGAAVIIATTFHYVKCTASYYRYSLKFFTLQLYYMPVCDYYTLSTLTCLSIWNNMHCLSRASSIKSKISPLVYKSTCAMYQCTMLTPLPTFIRDFKNFTLMDHVQYTYNINVQYK